MPTRFKAFWNLSHKTTMYGDASDLVAFRLMPLESRFRKAIEADWSFKVLDMERRLVAFQDLSYGKVTFLEMGLWRRKDRNRTASGSHL